VNNPGSCRDYNGDKLGDQRNSFINCLSVLCLAGTITLSRMLKKGGRVAWPSSCSRNAHDQNVLVRRAHSRIDQATLENEMGNWEDARSWDHPSHPLNRVIVRCGFADSFFEHSAPVNIELWAKEMRMQKSRCNFSFVVGLLAVMGLFGCNQETPIEKTKAAAASGSVATQAAGQAAVDAIRTPMDQARQTESVLEQSAEQRAAEAKKSTE
jgi:hypothetical protein